MKTLLVIVSLAALAGCAAPPPGPAYYGTRAAPSGSADSSEWRVVNVTPVPAGTAARAGATVTTIPEAQPYVQYAPAPVYAPQPVYVPQPVYAPQPAYYWPPVSISLGLGYIWGSHGHGHGHGHGHRGGHRGGHGHRR